MKTAEGGHQVTPVLIFMPNTVQAGLDMPGLAMAAPERSLRLPAAARSLVVREVGRSGA